jgi:hypothetical protein
MAFAYNVGKSVGALGVTAVGLLSEQFTLSESIGFFCLGGYALSVIALKFLPETRGLTLEDVGEREPHGNESGHVRSEVADSPSLKHVSPH